MEHAQQHAGVNPPPVRPGVPRGRRLRLVLAVLGGMVALLCLGGVGVAFVVYDDATRIDRDSPDQVVSSYLRAALVQRDVGAADLYECVDTDLAAVEALRAEMERRESQFEVQVSVSWGPLVRTTLGPEEELIRTELSIAGAADGQMLSRRNELWEFRAANQDGWRVCSGRKVS